MSSERSDSSADTETTSSESGSDVEAEREPFSRAEREHFSVEGKSEPLRVKSERLDYQANHIEPPNRAKSTEDCNTKIKPARVKMEQSQMKTLKTTEHSDSDAMHVHAEQFDFQGRNTPSRCKIEPTISNAKSQYLLTPIRRELRILESRVSQDFKPTSEPSYSETNLEPFMGKSEPGYDSESEAASSESSDSEAEREPSRARSEHLSSEGKREPLRVKSEREHLDSQAKHAPLRAKSTEPSDSHTKIEPARVKGERSEFIARSEPYNNSNGPNSKDPEVIYVSSDEEKEVRKRYDTPSRVPKPSLDCSLCKNEMFAASKVHEHPFLPGVGVCSECYDKVFRALEFTKEQLDGHEMQCRWCGDGGTIAMCENCEKVFCKDCIVRNLGHKNGWLPILEDNNWICFCCHPAPLHIRINEFETFRKEVAGSSLEFFNLRQKSRAKSGKKSNKRPMQKEKKSSKRPVQNKSNKRTREEELRDMEEAFERIRKGVKLSHDGEYARAIKKYQKAIQYLEIDTQYFDDMKKQATRAKIGCYDGISTCMKKLVEEDM